ncbi:MAG: hypothetical protein GWP47_17030 [Actinobacteria bacterium]|nr:hypothetical protein [Actinomycetota bacterium]NCG37776.1 hypothetical protein [Actinomycetota bacterium]
MIVDPIRVCELLVGLGEVTVLGAVDEPDGPVRVHVETRAPRPTCPGCGSAVWAKDQRSVELGCDWHTINDTVLAYGTPLVEDPDRIGEVDALGLDETLFARLGRWRTQHWSTSIVDVRRGQLLDVILGRSSTGACEWFAERDRAWLDAICWATLDLSGPWRLAFTTMLPSATQVADPFHLVKLANQRLDDVRRRVQNETLGHSGRLRHPPRRRPSRRVLSARGSPTRPHDHEVALRDLGLASRSRIQRPDRSSEQPHQGRQANRVRVHQLPQLPHPRPALRRQTQLEAARHRHPDFPVKSEAPVNPPRLLRTRSLMCRQARITPIRCGGRSRMASQLARH